MLIKVLNESPFQVLTGAFTIGPSETGYELQVGATPKDFATLFSVGANTTRMVTNVANGSYFRLKNNVGEVTVNWSRTCVTNGGGSGSGTELTPVAEFPLGAAEGTVVALASGDTVGLYQFIDGEWVLVGADDPTKLLAVNELPVSAEPGTVMALYQEGEAGGGTWEGPANDHYTFNCNFSTLDTAQTYDIAYFPGDGGGVNYSNTCLKYVDGVWSVYTVATNPEDAEDTYEMIYPLAVGEHHELYTYAAYGYDQEEDIELGLDGNVLITDGETIMAGQYEDGVWGSLNDFNGALSAGAIHLYNISGESQEAAIGLYQYDGQNWSEVGGVDTEEIELPIAAAVNELKGNFEARLDQQYYKKAEVNDIAARKVEAGQVNVQIKDYVDPAIAEVNDTIEDKELPVSAALNKLNEDIATIDEVIPAAIVDINDRMVSSSTVKTIWRGSAAEYDAITVKDAATLYIII